ncbi:hypothetical protein I204_07196 [Kwoniella mangroviensis CBS 8886]|nr:hypothetical protein I204_07196 [Kwoniella mangroviensis CBS 8886]
MTPLIDLLPNVSDTNNLHNHFSDTSKIPDDVEKRSIDLSEGGKEINKKAVEGLQVVLSTVSVEGSTTLKSFVHSDFGTNWTAKELKEAPGLSIIGVKAEVVEHAEKKNVPLTHVRVGAFDLFVFKFQAGGTDVKGNVIQVFRDSLKNPLRITSLPFLGQATAQLLLHPDEIANKTYQVYDHEPTGQDFVDVLTKLYGSKPEITHYTEEEYQKAIQVPGTSAILAAIKAKWGDDNWGATSPRPEVKGWKSVSFEELTTEWAKQL